MVFLDMRTSLGVSAAFIRVRLFRSLKESESTSHSNRVLATHGYAERRVAEIILELQLP